MTNLFSTFPRQIEKVTSWESDLVKISFDPLAGYR